MTISVRNAEDADTAMDGDLHGAVTCASSSPCGAGAHVGVKSSLLLVAIAAIALEAFGFKPDEAARKLELVIFGGTASCSALNAAAATRMQEQCWTISGVKPDTRILDCMLQKALARERAAVAQSLGLCG